VDDIAPRPLEGIRVIELGIWIAGPAAAGIMADWGADVIKVEPPAGDPYRFVLRHLGQEGTQSPAFELDNRGKRDVVLDLRSEPDRQTLEDLLAGADVFVTNLRPSALERLHLDPTSLRERHPRLVVASVTGYGWSGPDRDRAGYDVGAFWARAGIAATLNPVGQPPSDIRPGLGDRVAAMSLVAGINAALLGRYRSGQGAVVDVSLLRTGTYSIGSDLAVQQQWGKRGRTRPRSEHESPLYNCYASGDGRWFWLLGLEGDRHWPPLLRALESAELDGDERFATGRSRREHRVVLIAALDEIFSTKDFDTWTARFDRADVWWAPVHSLAEVVTDPQAEAAGCWVELSTEDHSTRQAGARAHGVAGPVGFWGTDLAPRRPTPELGQHTKEILDELATSTQLPPSG
jgi:crotonobetainyl-CoA:carnitine CoA-transferase CaiB-like acyl-CoA transferase